MSGLMDSITGVTAKKQEAAIQAQQRKSLADLAAQQAQIDQASAAGSKRRSGSRMLTFAKNAGGATTLG